MKHKLKMAIGRSWMMAFLLVSNASWASIETTSPVWVCTGTTIKGNGGSGSAFTAFSQRMIQPIAFAGTISSIQDPILTDTDASWADGEFGTNGILSYVEFNNGFMVDIANTSSNNQSLTLAGSLSGIALPGDAYRVRSHFTIASLFGTNNETGLNPGLNPSQADNILLEIPQTQQTMSVFYFSNAVSHGWYRADFSPASNQVVYPEQGVLVRRITTGDLSLFLCGPVKTGPAVAPVDQGFNLVGTLQATTNLPLTALNLYTGDPSTGISSGLNPTVADNLLVLQANGSTATYFYYKDTHGNEGWLDAIFNSANTVLINAGSAFFIHRRSPNGAFNWSMPVQ